MKILQYLLNFNTGMIKERSERGSKRSIERMIIGRAGRHARTRTTTSNQSFVWRLGLASIIAAVRFRPCLLPEMKIFVTLSFVCGNYCLTID